MTGLPPTQKDSAGHLDKAYFSAAVQQYTAAYYLRPDLANKKKRSQPLPIDDQTWINHFL